MSINAGILEGKYFDGHGLSASPATLIFGAASAKLIGTKISATFAISKLRVSPRIGNADRFIALPNGAQLQCHDSPQLNQLPQEGATEGIVAWLERQWVIALACVAITVGLVLGGYMYALPIAAKYVAMRIPIETERVLGAQTLTWLDDKHVLRPSKLPPETQTQIMQGFDMLRHGLPMEADLRLEFRDSPMVGANAFALPGGTIVITDAMINSAHTENEVLAVLAHEIGHEELRHTMRQVLQGSATAVLVAGLTSNAASLSTAVTGLPVALLQARYSRHFETEADDYAFRLLKQRGISPNAFADIMERLARKNKGAPGFSFLATHPVTAERIRRARAAAD